jgi:pimeloyl-ACP methyl ester carboxylesterase
MPQPMHREGYATGPGGLRLYYRIDGEQGPFLVCANGIGVSTFFWEPFATRIAERYRVVRWDYRGHGRSDGPEDPREISVSACADDLAAVMDAAGVERAVHLGHSLGVQVGFELYARRPERVLALVPTMGTYRRFIETFFDSKSSLRAFEVIKSIVEKAPGLVTRATRPVLTSGVAESLARVVGIIDPSLAPHELMVPFMEHLVRMDLRTWIALAEDMQRYDASAILPRIEVPALVVAAERDLFTPLRVVAEMAHLIPGAELLVIPNATHAALIEQPDLLSLRVSKFLDERVFTGGERAAG